MALGLLLIGGAGFLGKHLAARAADRDIACTVVTSRIGGTSLSNLSAIHRTMDAERFAGGEGDEAILGASAVVYLATRSVPVSSFDSPTAELDENVRPAFDAFQRIGALNPAARIIFISSGGTVYGKTDATPIPESHPLAPISPYGLGKVLTEQTLRFCTDARNQPAAILRLSNLVGRHHRGTRQGLVMAVLRAIRAGGAVPVFGDGSHVRDYLDADDAADAILRVAALPTTGSLFGLWNLGSGRGTSVVDVIRLVGDVLGRTIEIEWRPPRAVDVPASVLDISLIRRDIGWEPTTPLRRSIEKIVEATEP